jgi:hypothetical protein
MRQSLAIITLTLALVVVAGRALGRLDPITWWSLVEVMDERTLKVRSDKGETKTITLACIGRAQDSRAPVAYIRGRLHDQKLTFWPLETSQTNWYERPMCVILDMGLPGGRGGDAVHDFPLLNEELLAWGHAPFAEVKTTADPHGLKARLVRATAEAERRQKEREERWKRITK